jgi:hypothetical protein
MIRDASLCSQKAALSEPPETFLRSRGVYPFGVYQIGEV